MSSENHRDSNQFQSLKKWIMLLEKFIDSVPAKTNVRQFTKYPETFTGSEAVKCIYNILPSIFEKEKCTLLVAKKTLVSYMNSYSRYIINVRDENNLEFCDNSTLYRLNWPRINTFLKDYPQFCTPKIPVRRAGSARCREEFNQKQQHPNRSTNSFSRASTNLESIEFNNPLIDGRMSISCNELSNGDNTTKELSPHKKASSSSSVRNNLSGMIVGSISRASASIFSLHRSASANERKPTTCSISTTTSSNRSSNRSSTTTNPKFLDEEILKENKFSSKNDKQQQIVNSSKSVFRVRTSSIINTNSNNCKINRQSRVDEKRKLQDIHFG